MEQGENLQNKITITKSDLIPYIVQQGRILEDALDAAKKKYGVRYNENNNIIQMYHRFGRPLREPDLFADEYFKIMQRKSDLPASVRYQVRDLCDRAIQACYADKKKKLKD